MNAGARAPARKGRDDMCTTCGCSHGETRIDGVAPARVDATPGFRHAPPEGLPLHRHADGTWHCPLVGNAKPAALGAVHEAGMSADRIVAIEEDILARNNLGEEVLATPAIVRKTLYVRTAGHLYAFREQKGE